MAAEKEPLARKDFARALRDQPLGAADVGHERARRSVACGQGQQVKDGAHWCSENHQIGVRHGSYEVAGALVNGPRRKGALDHFRAVHPHAQAAESGLSERQAPRPAHQAQADNRYAFERGFGTGHVVKVKG